MEKFLLIVALMATLLLTGPADSRARSLDTCRGALRVFVWLDMRNESAPFVLLPHHSILAATADHSFLFTTDPEGTLFELVPCGDYQVRSAAATSDTTLVNVSEVDLGRYQGLRVIAYNSYIVFAGW